MSNVLGDQLEERYNDCIETVQELEKVLRLYITQYPTFWHKPLSETSVSDKLKLARDIIKLRNESRSRS